MAQQLLNNPVLYPSNLGLLGSTLAFTSSALAASGNKCAWVGRVQTPNMGSKSIHKVHFLPGAITTGSSTLRLSVQALDTATGNPIHPDGTQLKTVDFADTAPTANTWYTTAALSADHSVNFGDPLAVVLEFNSYGSGSFAVKNPAVVASGGAPNNTGFVLNTGSWAAVAVLQNLMLEFSDGTFGTLSSNAFPLSNIAASSAYNNGSTPDEYALKFQVPFKCTVNGLFAAVAVTSAARDFSLLLSDANGTLATGSTDAAFIMDVSSARPTTLDIAEQVLVPNTDYYLSIRPDTANSITFGVLSVNANAHFALYAFGTTGQLYQRTDGGAWSLSTNGDKQRPIAGLRISRLGDDVGGGKLVVA